MDSVRRNLSPLASVNAVVEHSAASIEVDKTSPVRREMKTVELRVAIAVEFHLHQLTSRQNVPYRSVERSNLFSFTERDDTTSIRAEFSSHLAW